MRPCFFICLCGMVFLAPSCRLDTNKPGTPAPGTSSDNKPAKPADGRPMVFLEGVYATSAAPGQEPVRLFDEDPASGWQTQPGTGPDEGLMLYFATPQAVKSVKIMSAGSDNALAAADDPAEQPIVVYANGIQVVRGNPNEAITLPDNSRNVKSLYLRFQKTGKETTQQGPYESMFELFPVNASLAINQLEIIGEAGEPLRLTPPRRINGSVQCSSTLAPETAYSPANLFDARKEFVWVEGNKNNSGEGESITFKFSQAVNISAIQVWNGYQRSEEHFQANARVRDFRFGPAGGDGVVYTLRDTKAGQKFDLSPALKGSEFTLQISSIYPGKKYKDLAISEIVFFDGDQAFIMTPTQPDQYKAQMNMKARSTPLSAILNRRICNKSDVGEVASEQSIILRADGTFVMYRNEFSEGALAAGILADGNWELQSANAESAKVKVFGKWNEIVNWNDYYQGSGQKQSTRIFSDVLTITAEQLAGTKMIGVFFIP